MGQDPLEATHTGVNIVGPHVENFKEIYDYLGKLELSSKVNHHFNYQLNLRAFIKKK